MKKFLTLVFVLLMTLAGFSFAAVDIQINCQEPTVPISDDLYGLFFEDINFAADGGLYAEMVQNRSFEYYPVPGGNPLSERYHPLYAWEKVELGDASVRLSAKKLIPLNRHNTHYLAVHIENTGTAAGVMNTGYDGMPIDVGDRYDVSLYARRDGGRGSVTVSLELPDGTVCGSTAFEGVGRDWQKFESVITADRTADNARLVLTTTERGTLYLDMVSLFPQNTFKNRENGMRADLAQALEDLNPQFLRFPGGCIAHGHGLLNAYRWKDTVGDVAQRRGNWNRWGYHQTYGLGYFEYFQLCEDLGASPLPVVPVGVSCGFNSPYQVCDMEDLDIWIDDALDLIEFANGPIDSEWGRERAEMGHPEPFGLEYVCLGNEEHDTPELRERFPYFVHAIRDKYPDIKIIGTSGLGPQIPIYDLMDELDVYSSDEHYYENPEWYLQNQDRFDNFDRSGPKIFVGEYASRGNTLFNAVAEAAYLTGIERNGDMVDMTCYAPLFAHVDHTQWNAANLIWFDKRTVVKTPNYYVQQMFSCNPGDVYLRNTVARSSEEKLPTIEGRVGIGTWATAVEMQEARVNGNKLNPSKWQPVSGDYKTQNGLYVQTDRGAQPAVSLAKTKYNAQTVTYTVKARKTSGDEGFLLVFGAEDDQNYYWWNVGGWGNSGHGIERTVNGSTSTLTRRGGSIESGRWYTMKVELTPGRVRCYLDDELIHDYQTDSRPISVASTFDKATSEVIIKLVNPREKAVDATLHLNGVKDVNPTAKMIVLAGEGSDRNTIENPDNIKPQATELEVNKKFDVKLPAMSVQFIRIKVK